MPVVTIYGDTAEGTVLSTSTTYADARSGTGTATLTLNAGGAGLSAIGQNFLTPNYSVHQGFAAFDTSSITNPAIVEFKAWGQGGGVVTNCVLEARLVDWGATVTTGDFIDGSSLSALTLLASLTTVGFITGGYNTFTQSGSALLDNLNLSGLTRFALVSDRQGAGTTPTNDEAVQIRNGGFTGTTNDPILTVTSQAASSDEILTPDIDVAINSWTTDTGGTTALSAAIDELTASDTDYIQSPAGPTTAQYYETALETHADPASSTGHIVHYRYRKNVAGGNVGLTASLLNGSTELLTTNQAGIETDTTGWAIDLGGVLTRSTALFHSGSASLEADQGGGVGSNITTPGGTSGFPVTAGSSYTFSGYAQAVVTPRTVFYTFTWFDVSGATLSTSSITGVWDAIGSWTPFSKTEIAPTSAAYGQVRMNLPIPSTGEMHYFDTMSVSTAVIIDSWTHSNISSSWTQQDQTLSGAEADSITDYSDLRLRFTPDMVTTDQTVPVPTKVADRATANSNTAATTVDLVLTGLTVGNYLLIRSAANNVGGGGSATGFTLTNQSGTAIDLATDQVFQANVDPGSAGAGSTCTFAIAKISATSGTVRITYSGSVVQACVAEEWSGIHATTPITGSVLNELHTASTTLSNMSDFSVALGNVVYCLVAVEGPASDTYTGDSDTVNGSWVNLTELGTTIVTADLNQSTWGAYKTVTATGSQAWNATNSVARDSASLIAELVAAPASAPTIKAQVSWANLELPAGAATFAHSHGAQVGISFLPTTGPVYYGTGDT